MDLPTSPVQWGITGILLTIVVAGIYALMRGNLVPRRVMDERIKDLVEVIDSWKDAVTKRDEVIEEILPTLNEIKDLTKTNIHLIESLKSAVSQKVGGQDGA